MYVTCYAPCILCGQPFSFNPVHVPSIRVRGVKQPLCEGCVPPVNAFRISRGLPAIEPHPDAYEPCEESEILWIED